MSTRQSVETIGWKSPKFRLVTPDSVDTFYPDPFNKPGLAEAIHRFGGGQIIQARGYGSAFSADAAKDSLMDILVIVRNQWAFYDALAANKNIHLGTVRDSGFHALWGYQKANFYLGNLNFDGESHGAKLWVMDYYELLQHARGGRPEVPEGKGYLYVAGRLQKAMIPEIFDEATPEEKEGIDLAINQARIDGVWLALGLVPRVCDIDTLASTYTDLSYLADKRGKVEKANKSEALFENRYDDYREMLDPILLSFADQGIIELLGPEEDGFVKIMSPSKGDAVFWLAQCADHASKVNIRQNTFTMGPIEGPRYVGKKFIRNHPRFRFIPL